MTVVVCTRSLGHVSDEVDGFPKAVEILHLFLFCNSSFIDRGYCNKFSLCRVFIAASWLSHGLSLVPASELLIVVTSVVAEHWL